MSVERGWVFRYNHKDSESCRQYLAAGYQDVQAAWRAVKARDPAITELVFAEAVPQSLIRMFLPRGGVMSIREKLAAGMKKSLGGLLSRPERAWARFGVLGEPLAQTGDVYCYHEPKVLAPAFD